MERIHPTGGHLFYIELQIGVLERNPAMHLGTCQERNKQWTNEVCIHVEGAISDLHVTDAGYHADCVSRFVGSRAVRAAQNVKEVSLLHSNHSASSAMLPWMLHILMYSHHSTDTEFHTTNYIINFTNLENIAPKLAHNII